MVINREKIEICDCENHKNSQIHRITPCCELCPVCKANIRIGMLPKHLENTHRHFKELFGTYPT